MSLENKNPLCEDDPTIKDLTDQVYQAFSTIGFVYLRNHGIPQEMVGAELQLELAGLSVTRLTDELHGLTHATWLNNFFNFNFMYCCRRE